MLPPPAAPPRPRREARPARPAGDGAGPCAAPHAADSPHGRRQAHEVVPVRGSPHPPRPDCDAPTICGPTYRNVGATVVSYSISLIAREPPTGQWDLALPIGHEQPACQSCGPYPRTQRRGRASRPGGHRPVPASGTECGIAARVAQLNRPRELDWSPSCTIARSDSTIPPTGGVEALMTKRILVPFDRSDLVATVGKGGLNRLVMGRLADQVFRRARVPGLLDHPGWMLV